MNSPALQLWPIIVVIEDCFVPQWAEEVVRVAAAADIQLIGAVIACRAQQAEQLAASATELSDDNVC